MTSSIQRSRLFMSVHDHIVIVGVNCLIALSNISYVAAQVQVPDELNNLNPKTLQLPTKPEEVRIQGTQPITLEQALELARGHNLDLQNALSTAQKSRAHLREVQSQIYPTINLQTHDRYSK